MSYSPEIRNCVTLKFRKFWTVNPPPNNEILDQSKFKAFADNKIIDQTIEICFGKVENIVGKGENAGYQHFLLFQQCLQKASFTGLLKG